MSDRRLDPIARDAVWKHLVDLRANYGTTLFFTTITLRRRRAIVIASRLCARARWMRWVPAKNSRLRLDPATR